MNSRQPACIYFAGLAQHQHCEWLKGRAALESFANRRKLMLPYRATFSTMALEGGVISNLHAKRKGRAPVVHFRPYLDFAQQHGCFYAWVASFDVIDGGPRVNQRYWQAMRDASVTRLLPVFHQGEPWSLLEEYCAGSEFVGLGLQCPARAPKRWLDGCFSRIPSRVHVHGFAGTTFLSYPFASVDSTTWIHDLLDLLKVGGRAGSVLECQTRSELMALVKLKYERLPLASLHRTEDDGDAEADEARDLVALAGSAPWKHCLLDLQALRAVRGQAGSVLKCLSPRELMELVARKHERLPRLQLFRGLSAQEPSAATPGSPPSRHPAA